MSTSNSSAIRVTSPETLESGLDLTRNEPSLPLPSALSGCVGLVSHPTSHPMVCQIEAM